MVISQPDRAKSWRKPGFAIAWWLASQAPEKLASSRQAVQRSILTPVHTLTTQLVNESGTPTMNDGESIENWKTFWTINLLFHIPIGAKGLFKCLWCQKEEISTSVLQSNFSFTVVRCSAGHVPTSNSEESLGICLGCDADLVQKVTERKLECLEKGCRRAAMVDRDSVVAKLGKAPVMEKYVSHRFPKYSL